MRYLLLSAHYRQSFNFTFAGLDGARAALSRLDSLADAVRLATPKLAGRSGGAAKAAEKAFAAALDDDLNVAEALASLFEFARATNERIASGVFTKAERAAAEKFLQDAGTVLGFTFGRSAEDNEVPQSVLALVEKRDEARKEKRFAEADRIRDELKEKGWTIEDTPDGRRIKRT